MLRLSIFCLLISFAIFCHAQTRAPLALSLNEAILLAVRENPNVQKSQLEQVEKKYDVEIEQWKFEPHFALNVTKTTSQQYSVTQSGQVTNNSTAVQPSISLLTPFGTTATLTSTNDVSDHYHPSLSLGISQPLVRGFGRAIVEAALYNALDSEKIGCLNVENTLSSTIQAVINAYLDVVLATNTLKVDQDALKQAEQSVQQTHLFIQAGHKAGVELVTIEANVASVQARIENDKISLARMRYQLLQVIGIDPSSEVKFTTVNPLVLIKKYHIPVLAVAKKMIVEHDIQYQINQITFHGATQRSLLAAENNNLWQLNLEANVSAGSQGAGGGSQNAGINSLLNGVNQTDSVKLTLTVPLDERAAKITLAKLKIAVREAALSLQLEKWSKETDAINGWNTIYSTERSLRLSGHAEELERKAYAVALQKYTYGLSDSLGLQTAQQNLIATQQSLIGAQISYLKALVNFDQMLGRTLQTWGLQVKYD
jgi:outer membrane protein TolC